MNASVFIPKILFLVPLPPPVHGSSVASKQLQDSAELKGAIYADFINVSTSSSIDQLGRQHALKYWRFLKILWRVWWHLCTRRYDLCYIAPALTRDGVLKDVWLVLFCKFFRRKIVLHLFGKGAAENSGGRLYRFIYRRMFKGTRSLILSESLYSDIKGYVKPEDSFICRLGLPEITSVGAKPESGAPFHILFMGNLLEDKGPLVLLDACRILKEKCLPFVCTVVAKTGPTLSAQEYQNRIHTLALEQQVQFFNGKYGEEKDLCFQAADVFVFPTFYRPECAPMVLVEAMRYHLPIVSTHEGAIPDMVQDGVSGWLVPRRDAEALADRLAILIQTPDLCRAAGEEGFRRFLARYTQKQFEENIKNYLLDFSKRN